MIDKCKKNGDIKAIYFVHLDDVKSFSPFEMKRKYGDKKRIVHKVDMGNLSTDG